MARRDHKNRTGLNNPDNLRVKANINLSTFLQGTKNLILMDNDKNVYNDEKFFNTDGYHLNSYGFNELLKNWVAYINPDVVSVNKTDKGGIHFDNKGSQNSADKKSFNIDRKNLSTREFRSTKNSKRAEYKVCSPRAKQASPNQ